MMKMTHRIEHIAYRLACRRLGRQSIFLFVASLVVIFGGMSMASASGKRALTVRDAIETTRFMVADVDGKRSIAVSPDGRRYAAMLIRGDIGRDGVEVEIVAGGLDSIESAKPYSVARLFTRGLGASVQGGRGETPQLLMPMMNFPIWIDNARVAFLWEDSAGVRQVVAADVVTKEWTFLTNSATDVTSFGTGKHNTIVYEAKKEYSFDRSAQLFRDGFTIKNPEAYSLLNGVMDGASLKDVGWGLGEKYVQVRGASPASAKKINLTGGSDSSYMLSWPSVVPSVSPDGRLAVVSGTPKDVPDGWNRYQGETLQMLLRGWRDRSYSSARSLQMAFAVSVDSASARPLWNAPTNPLRPTTIRWAPNSRNILAWPVYLPPDAQDVTGLAGNAVAEIDVITGNYAKLPIEDASKIEDARWLDSRTVEIRLERERVLFGQQDGQWVEVERGARQDRVANVRVELRQDANTPPALYAVDTRTRHERMVFDPNPKLRTEFALGEVKFIEWRDKDGYRREGRLFLPVSYISGRRYPLVIQTRTWGSRDDFTLYGKASPSPTLGPMYSVHLAQPLANQGIAVLQLGPRPANDPLPEAKSWMRGIESAVDHLYAEGLIDRNRVGIMGHSRAGWHISYALAFSDYSFAAAIADDFIDSGYVEATFMGYLGMSDHRNGPEEPFGSGLKDWLENAPAFNVEHIRAPLLMMATDSFAGKLTPIARWELFSRLRHLRKPVEFWVVPNIERGSHNLQNPTQLLAQQERGMDWWLYWLKDERDPSSAKQDQYAGWDKLRLLRDEDAKRPMPPRLKWSAEPAAQ